MIVVNAGDNQFDQSGSFVMDENDVHEVVKAAPNAKVISVHMEPVNHWKLSREDLKKFAAEKGIEITSLFLTIEINISFNDEAPKHFMFEGFLYYDLQYLTC